MIMIIIIALVRFPLPFYPAIDNLPFPSLLPSYECLASKGAVTSAGTLEATVRRRSIRQHPQLFDTECTHRTALEDNRPLLLVREAAFYNQSNCCPLPWKTIEERYRSVQRERLFLRLSTKYFEKDRRRSNANGMVCSPCLTNPSYSVRVAKNSWDKSNVRNASHSRIYAYKQDYFI